MILVIDDYADARQLLATLLTSEGYLVTTAPDAATALDILAAAVPALIIVDRGLPDEDGLSLLRKIRADARLAAVPAIMFSAFGDAAKLEALAAGANLYLKKGVIDTSTIVESVHNLIGAPPSSEAAAAAAERNAL